ncbi:MAG: cation-translocating P-type ATPase [Phycisphaerae bacterium]|nr:cation-translocating P-type ATPase [Phycisphaerae bacterium]
MSQAGTPHPVRATHEASPRSGGSLLGFLVSPKGELAGAIVAGAFLLAGAVFHTLLKREDAEWLVWVSLSVGMVYGLRAAWQAVAQWRIDIDVLMIVGAGLAAYIGHPEEGALLLFLFTLAGALEELAMQRTKREVEALNKLMPVDAIVRREGQWVEADPDSLVPGEVIKVRPGERVPTDAVVTSGATSFDQSAITGESMPRGVEEGDELYAGTINTDAPVEARVLRPVRESSLQKILNLVTQAAEQREPVQRIIDRVSEPYALGVMGISFAVLMVWWLALGRAWSDALYTSITLLIVASPCALVIATPTATLAAIARAARAGLLFKGGQAIERLSTIGAICFDKTGTLTMGRPQVYEIQPVAWSDPARLLSIAAGLEADSTHPIAAAVRDAASKRGASPATIGELGHITGKGISGAMGAARVRLGSYPFAEELIPICLRARVRELLEQAQGRGHVAIVAAHESPDLPAGGEAAVILMADPPRPGAHEITKQLHELGVRPARMLTGDNRRTAERVAAALGIDQVDAELLPENKVEIVRRMRDERKHAGMKYPGVALMGDGVNDAPALAAADLAIGMGAIGSDAALESSDVVLLAEHLSVVPWGVELARRTRTIVKANLVFALGVIVLMSIATLVGSLLGRGVPLSIGVLAHEGGTILVVANSLRLLLVPSPRTTPQR